MKLLLSIFALAFAVTGCSMFDIHPDRPDGRARILVNSPAAISAFLAEQKNPAAMPVETAYAATRVKLSLQEILEQYIPQEFQVFPESGMNLGAIVSYDKARPWAEAFSQSLGMAGIDMVVYPERKVITLASKRLSPPTATAN